MDISKIIVNPNNPRTIRDEKFKSLVKSLNELPVMTDLREVLLDENNVIIGGNMRFRAAKEAGWKEIPTKVFTREMAERNNKLTNQDKTYEEYVKEIVVKDNVSGGEWDWEMLANQYEKEELEDWGMDVDKWADDEVIEDEVPEVTENPKSKLGEIYQLGRHRVMCGDSTKIEDVERLMDGKKADMVFTDPPYGLGIDGQKKSVSDNPKHNRKRHDFRGWDSERPSEDIFNFIVELDIPSAIFGGNYFADLLPATRGWLFWGKGQDGSLTSSDGELVWTNKDKPLRSVIVNRAELQGSVHPTQKPITVVKFCLDYLEGGEKVLDLFLGSGSTLIACEQTNRICFGMEIDPKYVDVIRKRYAKFIGKEEEWETLTAPLK